MFPGDPSVEIALVSDPGRGDLARVTRLSLSAHAGTHVDGPNHVPASAEGPGVESVPLHALIGPALVVEASAPRVLPRHVRALPASAPPRILFRGAPVLSAEAARALVLRGILLVGTDGLSLDAVEDAALPAHVVLLQAGVAILECLDLSAAGPGRWELLALPLLIPGADGAPARAVLRRPIPRARRGPRG